MDKKLKASINEINESVIPGGVDHFAICVEGTELPYVRYATAGEALEAIIATNPEARFDIEVTTVEWLSGLTSEEEENYFVNG